MSFPATGQTTYASLFSGGGLADVGARDAGLTPIWGVEYDPLISAVAEQNGLPSMIADVLTIDPNNLEPPTVLHASPPCPNFSVAKTGGAETDHDIAMGAKVADFITVLRPPVFTLENVYAYRDSLSFRRITDALTEAGYFWDYDHINAADYGVPQTRQRLILRALRGALLPHLPEPEPWIGWYAAIEDLIPTLPASQFAPWQLARLPEELQTFAFGNNAQEWGDSIVAEHEPFHAVTGQTGGRDRAFIVGANGTSMTVNDASEPAATFLSSQKTSMPRAFIVQGTSTMEVRQDDEPSAVVMASVHTKAAMPRAFIMSATEQRTNTARLADEPIFTLKAVGDRAPRAWLSQGRVVSMTPRALARFQSVPDSYTLPAKNSLATKIIGNGVACLMYQKLVSHLLIAVPA